MPRSGPRTVRRYSDEFKLAAVRLSQEPGIQVQTVAAALAIHPVHALQVAEGRARGPLAWSRAEGAGGDADARAGPAAAARAGVRAPPRGARPLKKSHPVLFRSRGDVFAFIASLVVAPDARRSVSALCRRYGVTRGGFYSWQRRGVSVHEEQDRQLLGEIA